MLKFKSNVTPQSEILQNWNIGPRTESTIPSFTGDYKYFHRRLNSVSFFKPNYLYFEDYSYRIKEGDVKKFKLEFQTSLFFTRCKNIWVLILHREHDFLSYFCQSNKYVLINALCIEDSHSFLNSIWKKYMYMWSITYSYMYLKPNYFKRQSSS